MLLEAVPNISEGRRADVIAAIRADAVRCGAHVADVHSDADHHRTVLTLFARDEPLVDALYAIIARATSEIDLRKHTGVHPRIGACDVVPIIAMQHEDAGAAHAAARELATRVGEQLEIPVLAYGVDAAGRPVEGAGFTGALRRGGLDEVARRMATGELVPIAGPREPHPRAGVTMIGVRRVLVAFNVDLNLGITAHERDIARDIARELRALDGIRALAFELASAGRMQVSTNIERWQRIGPAQVLERVARAAAARDISVHRAELVGLAPQSAHAQLRYACTKLGVSLAASPTTLDAALADAHRAGVSD